jgi:recombinational DNA repair protein RecR
MIKDKRLKALQHWWLRKRIEEIIIFDFVTYEDDETAFYEDDEIMYYEDNI